ncbi:HAD family hydrolase [Leucobacter aridicollis]
MARSWARVIPSMWVQNHGHCAHGVWAANPRKAPVSAPPAMIFDFDGTVSLGDGPVLAYAQAVADGSGSDEFLPAVREHMALADGAYIDGYDLVRGVALEWGIAASALAQAYLASRELLATPAAPVAAPAGLAEFLERAPAERILLTNAPEIRIEAALDALGLRGAFDAVITSAGKPAGISDLLDRLGPERRVLSVGDVWQNDLAPVHARGHATALVGSHAQPDARPDYAGPTVTELLPALRAWLDGR